MHMYIYIRLYINNSSAHAHKILVVKIIWTFSISPTLDAIW